MKAGNTSAADSLVLDLLLEVCQLLSGEYLQLREVAVKCESMQQLTCSWGVLCPKLKILSFCSKLQERAYLEATARGIPISFNVARSNLTSLKSEICCPQQSVAPPFLGTRRLTYFTPARTRQGGGGGGAKFPEPLRPGPLEPRNAP